MPAKNKKLEDLQKEYSNALQEAKEIITDYRERFDDLKKKYFLTLAKAKKDADDKKISAILKSIK